MQAVKNLIAMRIHALHQPTYISKIFQLQMREMEQASIQKRIQSQVYIIRAGIVISACGYLFLTVSMMSKIIPTWFTYFPLVDYNKYIPIIIGLLWLAWATIRSAYLLARYEEKLFLLQLLDKLDALPSSTITLN